MLKAASGSISVPAPPLSGVVEMHWAGENLSVLLCPGRVMCDVRSTIDLGYWGWVPNVAHDAVLHPGRL